MNLKKCQKPIVFGIVLCLLTGGFASWLTADGLRSFSAMLQPPLTPPMPVFPVVWSLLLILMGIGIGQIWCSRSTAERALYDNAVTAFWVQLTLFLCWMLWFFGLGWYGFAVLWTIGLITSIVIMIRNYSKISGTAASLQIPYLLWCCFALYLTVGVWWLNR